MIKDIDIYRKIDNIKTTKEFYSLHIEDQENIDKSLAEISVIIGEIIEVLPTYAWSQTAYSLLIKVGRIMENIINIIYDKDIRDTFEAHFHEISISMASYIDEFNKHDKHEHLK